MSPILKKAVSILKYLFLALILLFLLIVGAVNLPVVHKAITKKTNTILAEKGLPIHIGKITLLLNGKIGFDQLEIIRSDTDTILYAGKASIDFRPLPLLKKQVIVKSIKLENVVANIITDEQSGLLNIISLFSVKNADKPQIQAEKDTTQTGLIFEIQLGQVDFKNIRFVYSDPQSGIFLKQSIEMAAINFESFSILDKQIDVRSIEIQKSNGLIAITTSEKDTTDTSLPNQPWKFSLQNLEIGDLQFTLDQPDAGQRIDVALKSGNISLEKLDLATSEILVRKAELNEPQITFFNDSKASAETMQEAPPTGFSIPTFPWTIIAESFKIKDGNFAYTVSDKDVASALEKWFPVHDINASFENTRITPSGYNLNLEKISLALANTLKIQSGSLQINTDSVQNIGLKADLSALVAGNKISGITKETQFDFSAALSGSAKSVQIENLGLQSSSGFSFNIAGKISDLLQIPQSECDLKFSSGNTTRNQLSTIVNLIDSDIKLPGLESFVVSGSIGNSLDFPVFTLNVNSGSGNIKAEGSYDVQNSDGELDAWFTDILVSELLGETYPEKLSGNIHLNGGLNRSNQPEGEVFLEIDSVLYKNKNTLNLKVNAQSQNNEVTFNAVTADSALNCNFEGRFGWPDQKTYNGALKGNFDIDLFALNFISQPFAGKGNIDASFDFSSNGDITSTASIDNFTIQNENDTVSIEKTEFELNTTDSLIESHLESDFISMHFKSRVSLADFKNALDSTQLRKAIILDSTNFINLKAISNLDFFSFDATVRYDSVFNLFYPDSVLKFSDINLNIQKPDINSRAEGTLSTKWITYNNITSYTPQLLARIEPEHLIFQIKTDSIIADEIKFGKSGFDVDVLPSSINGNFEVYDINDSILHQIGFQAKRENNEVIFKSATPSWLINRIPWTLSPPQFLTFDKSEKSFIASLDMNSGNKRLWVKGNSAVTVELDLKNIELKNLAFAELIGFVPEGTINGNIKYIHKEQDNLELNLEMQKMKWNNIYFNLLTAKGHLVSDSTGIHSSELLITADDSLSLLVEMETNKARKEYQVNSKFNKLQFQLFEPFITDYANNLHGTSSGEIVLNNKEDKIALDGEIRFKNFGLKIIPLKTWLTIPDNKIEIKQNQFVFDNFTVIDSLNRPLTVNGRINFENSDDVRVDLKVKADKIQLMNTSESKNAPLFGTLIVNSGLTIGGNIYSPTIKGNIELESGTNLTYQLIQDLSVKGSQNEVVFATITDSMKIIYPESGIAKRPTQMPNIETTISINPKSIFNVKIADLYNVDITIAGNGLLNYNMLPNNTMSLNGSYEIRSGECKLKITGWPLKNFNITSGSTFNWNGSVEDPELNLEATTKVRGSYLNPIDNKSRAVDFIVSMKLKNRLSNLAIVFDIQSPDQYITSVLSSLSTDDMMQQAINLLLFETINIPGIESSSNYLSSQISSFWESQLNALTGTTFNKTKLSFGVDTYDQSTSAGGKQEKTSLTYEMERKFMKDRATIKVSGRLNDYNEGSYQSNSLINNFIFEYALDSLNTKNLKLYQKRDYEDMLEGEVTKFGIGFLYRKNYKKLHDIWRREKKQKEEKQKNSNN